MKKRIVIKLGGSTLQNPQTLEQLAKLVRGYQQRDYQVVVVHGGGPAVNAELTRRQISWQFIDGQRQTTPAMMAVIEEVLAKQVNGALVQTLRAAGLEARGFSGADDLLFCTAAGGELMQVGQVQFVDHQVLERWLAASEDAVPVIAPIGIGHGQQKFNINADWAATKIASALNAQKLIFLTDQEGILDERRQLIARATPTTLRRHMAAGVIAGGMSTKVQAMIAALHGGVAQVRVLSAVNSSQLLTDKKMGTLLSSEIIPAKRGAAHVRAS